MRTRGIVLIGRVVPLAISSSWRNIPRGVLLLWLLAFAAIPIWMAYDPPGWDVAVYHNTMRSLAAGHDPYSDDIAAQKLFHSTHTDDPNADPPFSYLYAPITLPLLRLIGALPTLLAASVYWPIYLVAVLAQIWVAFRAVEPSERHLFLYLAPLAPFFPGLLANGTVIGGNIAYILYAAVLLAAVYAWNGNSWRWFYLAVLVASCVKAPLLSLVTVPILSARRQWLPTALTVSAGLTLFAIQPRLWPTLFAHYVEAFQLLFGYTRELGCSPAGLFIGFLHDHRIPYSPAGLIFYVAYAIPLFALLIYLSRLYLGGRFPFQQWFPVLLTGVILLNPRLIEYDVNPLALPLALIAWRVLIKLTTQRRAAVILSTFFVVLNAFALTSWALRKLIDGPLLVAFFLAGAWTLLHQTRHAAASSLPASEAILQSAV